MWFSDLENLLSIERIFYQLGESYLNLFLLHKVENLWSVRNLWSIFTSLSALEDFLSNLGEGGGLLTPNKWPSIHDFEPNMSHKMLSFCDFTLFWYSFPIVVWFDQEKRCFWWFYSPFLHSYYSFPVIWFDPEKRISYPSLLKTRLFQMICVFHGMRKGVGWSDIRKAKIV